MANTPHDEAHAMMITREVTPDGERYTLSLCQSHAGGADQCGGARRSGSGSVRASRDR